MPLLFITPSRKAKSTSGTKCTSCGLPIVFSIYRIIWLVMCSVCRKHSNTIQVNALWLLLQYLLQIYFTARMSENVTDRHHWSRGLYLVERAMNVRHKPYEFVSEGVHVDPIQADGIMIIITATVPLNCTNTGRCTGKSLMTDDDNKS